jgi:hypothetical protein
MPHDFAGSQQSIKLERWRRAINEVFIGEQVIAQLNAIIADEDVIRASDETVYLIMAAPAK